MDGLTTIGKGIRAAVAAALFCGATTGRVHGQATLYGIADGNLYRINKNNASTTFVGSSGAGDTHGLGYDPLTGDLFAATRGNNSLYRIDPNTAAATLIGNIGFGISGLAIDGAGTIYVTAGGLYRVSRVNAAPTFVGSSPADNISFDLFNGIMYSLQHRGAMHIIDPTTGAGTQIWGGDGYPYNGVAYDPDTGDFYGAESSLVRITFPGPSVVNVGSVGANMRGLEFALPPTQACCLPNTTCADLSPTDCANQGGSSQGASTSCAAMSDADSDGSPDACESCDNDPSKTSPGQCGCGVADTDTDTDGVADCNDVCAGFDDNVDTDGDGVPDGCDLCPGSDDNVDCNGNSVPDGCDIGNGDSFDCNGNGTLDECEVSRWIGPSGDTFYDADNWDPAGVPGSDALIEADTDDNLCALDIEVDVGVCKLTVRSAGAGQQTLQIGPRAVLTAATGTVLDSGGRLDLRGGRLAGGMLVNNSNTVTGYGTIASDIENNGLISVSPLHALECTGDAFENSAAGSVQVAVGGGMSVEAGDVTQAGLITVRANGTAVFSAPLVNASGGLISLLGGVLATAGLTNDAGASVTGFGTVDGSVTNYGEIVLIADTQVVGDLDNEGTITIQNGILTVTGNLSGSGAIVGGGG